MGRINVYTYDDDGDRYFAGHFHTEAAERFGEATVLRNNGDEISVATGSQWDHEALYHTRQDTWVLAEWSDHQDRPHRYTFIDSRAAKKWLAQNDQDDATEQYFGQPREETGPNLGGRPAIGGEIKAAIGTDLRDTIDRLAKQAGVPRAGMVRDLLESAVAQRAQTP